MTALWIAVLVAGCGAKSHFVTDGEADTDSYADAGTTRDAAPAPEPEPEECDYEPPIDPGRECVPRFENAPPASPRLVHPPSDTCLAGCPTFRVENATDPDGDPLRHHFALDWDPNFRSSDLQRTPTEGIPEDASGFTEWQPLEPVLDCLPAYYLETWADDCIDESDRLISIFRVCCPPSGPHPE